MVPKQLEKRFEMFKERYGSRYTDNEWAYIEENFYSMIHSDETPDLLMQVYSELDIVPSAAMFYHKHFKLLRSIYPIDGNIVEVASGRIPAFANIIASEQKRIGKGTITIYDPLLIQLEPKYPNITLNKEYFYKDTDISAANLVVGIMPCESTELILENAISNDKDFYVAMCGCVHSPFAYMPGYYITPEMYQEEVISKAERLLKEYGTGELEVTKLQDSPIDYPILYRRR